MNTLRPTRFSTCGSLCLPVELACDECKKSIENAIRKNLKPKKMKKCLKPFGEKWKTHRLKSKVQQYNNIQTYLETKTTTTDTTTTSTNTNHTNSQAPLPTDEKQIICDSSITIDIEKRVSDKSVSTCEAQEKRREISTVTPDNNNNNNQITHTTIHRPRLGVLQGKADAFDAIINQVSYKKYTGSDLGDMMIATAASLVPQCGYSGLSSVIPLAIGSVFANAGIPLNYDKLVDSQPSHNYIKALVEKNAVDNILLAKDSIGPNPCLYISIDKGNKKGNKNLAKYICWYCKKEKKVKTFLLDVDCTDEKTDEIVEALTHSLDRMFPLVALRLRGQCTDSGGGGTKYALSRQLSSRNMCHPHYLVATCSLHNLQTCLRNAVVNVLGEGGMDEKGEPVMNVMQMLHGAYNLQNWQETEELNQLWEYLQEDDVDTIKFRRLEEPVMTRWWLVGACACSFSESIYQWRKICNAIRNSAPSGSASSKIASCTLNLIDSKPIRNDLQLIVSFHTTFLFPHFKYLQTGDVASGATPSFQARHLLVRLFLMQDDLKEIKKKWKENSNFELYVSTLNDIEDEKQKEQQQKKLTEFYRYTSESLTTHFKIWYGEHLFFGLFSEQKTATEVAKVLLGIHNRNAEVYLDHSHGRLIKCSSFFDYLIKNVTQETIMYTRSLSLFSENSAAIALIAGGANIWNSSLWNQSNKKPLLKFCNLYLHQYSALPTNTQFVERGVKESGYVSLGRRGERQRSILAISRAKLIPDAIATGKEELNRNRSEEDKQKQLQGKQKTKILVRELIKSRQRVRQITSSQETKRSLKQALTMDNCHFKKIRIKKKLNHIKSRINNSPAPNVYQRRTGETLTPLIQGKIQFHKLKKKFNIQQIRSELREREIEFEQNENWTTLIKRLKQHENNNKYFTPLTPYDSFLWNSTHFDADGNPIISID